MFTPNLLPPCTSSLRQRPYKMIGKPEISPSKRTHARKCVLEQARGERLQFVGGRGRKLRVANWIVPLWRTESTTARLVFGARERSRLPCILTKRERTLTADNSYSRVRDSHEVPGSHPGFAGNIVLTAMPSTCPIIYRPGSRERNLSSPLARETLSAADNNSGRSIRRPETCRSRAEGIKSEARARGRE